MMNIFLAAAALSLSVVTNTAPDGVNKVYTTVDTNGNVMGEAMTMVHVVRKYTQPTYVYRLEITGETPYIVGCDGERRRVCIMDPDEYEMLTGRIDRVWQSFNSTADGRSKLHGKRVGQVVDSTNGVKVSVYADGYRHSEKFQVMTSETRDAIAGRKRIKRTERGDAAPAPLDWRYSERYKKYREEMEKRKKTKVKVVTIEHDAVTGKDEVK